MVWDDLEAQELFQSTPAITDGRREEDFAVWWAFEKFQSTPAITDGRRAYARCRELLAQGFNPRPPSLTGDALPRLTASTAAEAFQSTPAITDGRRASPPAWRRRQPGFNPRPPSLTGDALDRLNEYAHTLVSIHARHH